MADIRLHKISIEPSQNLTIQNGDVLVSNTTPSTSRLTGAFIVNGGISINNTSSGISSTNGGALTVGGGTAISGDLYLGGNVILDSNVSSIAVKGIDTPRLFVSPTGDTFISMSADGKTTGFKLTSTNLTLNATTSSTNTSTGAFITNGGISIQTVANATNSSSGGALTVAGGAAIGKDLYVANNAYLPRIVLDSGNVNPPETGTSTSNISMYATKGNMFVFSSSNFLFKTITSTSSFSINSDSGPLLTINNSKNLFKTPVQLSDTLTVAGSTLFQNSADATGTGTDQSVAAVSINGGLSVGKSVYTGNAVHVNETSSTQLKLILYTLPQDPNSSQPGQVTGLGTSTGSMVFQLVSDQNDYLFQAGGTGQELFKIKGSGDIYLKQNYTISSSGTDLNFQNQSIATSAVTNFFTADSDGTDSNDIRIFSKGTPSSRTNSEYLKLGWDAARTQYTISTNQTGTGRTLPLTLQSTFNQPNQLTLPIDGTVFCGSTIPSLASTSGAFTVAGGIAVSTSVDATSITSGGALTVAGGLAVNKNVFLGGTLNIQTSKLISNSSNLLMTHPTGTFNLASNAQPQSGNNQPQSGNSQSNLSSLSLFTLNNAPNGNYEAFNISLNTAGIFSIRSIAGGTGTVYPIQISSIFLATNGNVGVNTTTPQYPLDINGSIRSNSLATFNQLAVTSTDDAQALGSGGGMTVAGGFSVMKSMFVGGHASFASNMDLTGALGVSSSGYFGGSIYTQQNINATGAVNALGTVTASYINVTNAIVTNGGITINSTTNATNNSNGGALTVAGGGAFGKDLYVSGTLNQFSAINLYATNLINIFNNTNLRQFSIDRDLNSNDLSLSRYDTTGQPIEKTITVSNQTGQITFNNTTSSTSSTSGSIVLLGGLSIANTTDATSGTGTALNVAGGTIIGKTLTIGGDTTISSTTGSSNSNTGALRVSGGVGINGNVNIAGDTVIAGNLSILGATNSVFSTNTFLSDNVILINSGPSGTSDAGLLIQRYQTSNDTGSGDVVNDTNRIVFTIPNQSGMTSVQLKLSISASSVNETYTGWWVKIESGYSANQVRKIIRYDGATRTLTISNPWTTQNPSIGDTVSLFSAPYVGLFWDENLDLFEIGSTVTDPSRGNVTISNYSKLIADSLQLVNPTIAKSSTSGSIVIAGGLSIANTTDAVSVTSGNGLTIAGGASIAKSLYIGNNLYVNNVNITPNPRDIYASTLFSAMNNVTLANIPGLNFSDNTVWGADIYLSARLFASQNLYTNYHIRIVNQNTAWSIATSYVGDNTASFSITNTGQIQYTTPNYTNFTSLTFKYRLITT